MNSCTRLSSHASMMIFVLKSASVYSFFGSISPPITSSSSEYVQLSSVLAIWRTLNGVRKPSPMSSFSA